AGNGRTIDLAWRVPIDDVEHSGFTVSLRRVGDAAAHAGDAQYQHDASRATVPAPSDVAAAILAGSLRLEDVPERADLLDVEDHIAQMGQVVIADRTQERLGRT